MRRYVSACERHGRKAKQAIIADVSDATGHPEEEVRRYDKVFWKRYTEVQDWEKLLEKIKKGEKKIARRLAIEHTLQGKVAQHRNPFATLTINYGSSRGKAFTEEEDRFLVCMTAQLGYGAWELLKLEIRKAWQVRSTSDMSLPCSVTSSTCCCCLL
jgi:SWI/SNF-related matrix-associated actin-dependent regulator of chromatin subfamily A member 5